jgi:hypothetical protein
MTIHLKTKINYEKQILITGTILTNMKKTHMFIFTAFCFNPVAGRRLQISDMHGEGNDL